MTSVEGRGGRRRVVMFGLAQVQLDVSATDLAVGVQFVTGAEREPAVKVPLVAASRLRGAVAGQERSCPAHRLPPIGVLGAGGDDLELLRHGSLLGKCGRTGGPVHVDIPPSVVVNMD